MKTTTTTISPTSLILIFYAMTLPVLFMFLVQHSFIVDCFPFTTQQQQPAAASKNALEDILSAYLTQSIGRNLSNLLQSFLQENPLPPTTTTTTTGNPYGDADYDKRKNRQRRYVIRDPNDLNVILAGISNARNWTGLMQEVSKLASHFWYGEWCGAGWSKINESASSDLCCKCRGGAKTESVDTTLIRNTANDCIKCGAHPIDPVDTGCMLHDICYTCTQSPFNYVMANCECERIISYSAKAADCTRSVSRLYPQMNETMRYRWCTFYKGAIPLLFENKPCYCPRNGQPFVAFSLGMCDRGQYLIPVRAK